MESLSLIPGMLAGSAAFWLAYRVVMYNRPMHRSARVFLIIAMVVPIIAPVLQRILVEETPAYLISYRLPEQIVGAQVSAPAVSGWSAGQVLGFIYALVALGLLVRQLSGTFKLLRRLGAAKRSSVEGIPIYAGTGYGPGSIGRAVFFPEPVVAPEILAHEAGHVRLGHRFDLAFANMICFICWMNPFVWMLRRELRLVHEFEADAFAAGRGVAAESYATILLRQSFGLPSPGFSHAFFHHPIKQRIAMLFKPQSSRPRRAGRVLAAGMAVTLISASLLFVQCRQEAAVPEKVPSTEVFKHVDQMPEFKGDMNDYLVKSLQYPDAARKAGSQGRCVVQFVVTSDGSVTDPKIVRSSGSVLLDDEAMRVVRNMPAWKPGSQKGENVNVQFSLPITFRLDDEPVSGATSFRDIESPHRVPAANGNFECVDHVTDRTTQVVHGTFRSDLSPREEPITVSFSVD